MKYTCPICGWPDLEEDPSKGLNEICACCGNEFGVDDCLESNKIKVIMVSSSGNDAHAEEKKNVSPLSTQVGVWLALREIWIREGMQWFDGFPPKGWNAKKQLENI